MSNVNADMGELLQVAQNMQNAASIIEITKSMMAARYHQLGENWNDRRYKELGDIVQECNKALNDIQKTILQGKKFIDLLAKKLQEYENITLEHSSNQGQAVNGMCETSRSFGSNGGDFSTNIFSKDKNINEALNGVEYRPIEIASSYRSEQQIISSISGGDMTEGSCSSLALAYAGNRAGYIVYDFRDGKSREVFSSRSLIEQIANMDGVNSVILRGLDDTICAEQLMSCMESGKQYYMATGAHAAVVRLNDEGIYQYLELQSGIPSENGWHSLTLSDLYSRFGCEDGQSREYANYIIDLDSLQNNTEFLELLGYINTDEYAQMRGERGHVR